MPLDTHLQLIHSTIVRLSGQSTTVKGWSVTLTAALLGFGAASTPVVTSLAVYVILAFAVLDAYYLAMERAYRRLYSRAATGEAENWTLTVDRLTVRDVSAALRSATSMLLYGTSLLVAAGFATYLFLR